MILNLYLTTKIVKYFKIFGFNEKKKILKWTYILTASILLSYFIRISINMIGIFGGMNILISEKNLKGEDKLIYFLIIIIIEGIPLFIWIIYIAQTKGEIERTLSVSLKSSDNGEYQHLDVGGTATLSSNDMNQANSVVVESF